MKENQALAGPVAPDRDSHDLGARVYNIRDFGAKDNGQIGGYGSSSKSHRYLRSGGGGAVQLTKL